MKQKRALIVVTSHNQLGDTGKKTGYWLSEVTRFYRPLHRLGFEVDIVSPKGGKAPMDPISRNLRLPINLAFLTDKKAVTKLDNTLTPDEITAENYMVIYYVGGHGAMWDFADNTKLAEIAKAIYDSGGIVASVCHGAAGLLNIPGDKEESLITGKKLTGFSNREESLLRLSSVVPFMLESELKWREALYTKGWPIFPHVETDGRIITGQNPQSTRGVAHAVIKLLQEMDPALKPQKQSKFTREKKPVPPPKE